MQMKNQKAITLIALIVTIIILLILAGVAISALSGDNGLIARTKQARKAQIEAEIQEDLTLALQELQVEKEGSATIEDITQEWLENKLTEYEITVTEDSETNSKIIAMSKSGVTGRYQIDSNLNIIDIIDNFMEISKIEATYKVNETIEDIMKITIVIKSDMGISKIITPEGKEIIPQNNKEMVGIDYEVKSGTDYTFKVQISGIEEIQEYVLKANTNAKPIINENISNDYPELTQYGIEINKEIEIDYGEGINNYYSLDDGETWYLYTGTIKVKKSGKIKAKTLCDNEITKEDSKNYTINLADDALGSEGYDNDPTTYAEARHTESRLNIDESIWNKTMNLDCHLHWNSGAIIIKMYNSQGNVILEKIESISTYGRVERSITVEENTAYITFLTYANSRIYEITITD